MKSQKKRFLASLFLALLLSTTATQAQSLRFHAGAGTRGASRAGEAEWTLAFELAFGDATPYSRRFPSLYDEQLPYEVRRAITKYVLDKITRIALRETGARLVELAYRPGGYKDFPVVPSAQLRLRASDLGAQRALNIIGYLAQQTAVIGSKRTSAGERLALEIIERGGRRLAQRDALEKFWRRIAALSPKLGPGFSSMERRGRPGLYIIDSEGDWRRDDLEGFAETIRAASKERGIETVVRNLTVQYVEVGNDWKTQEDGASYLDRLSAGGQAGLRLRLVRQYQPQVERLIAHAFKKYAPVSYSEKRAA